MERLTKFLSTPSARRATQAEGPLSPVFEDISIHALCEEGDACWAIRLHKASYFYPRPLRGGRPALNNILCKMARISIHALCEEGDDALQSLLVCARLFLSTPSARRATLCRGTFTYTDYLISIHALCEEGDGILPDLKGTTSEFLSTPSARRATLPCHRTTYTKRTFLSTPSARRATVRLYSPTVNQKNFYPRPLRGGRLNELYHDFAERVFLSTPSARRATTKTAASSTNGNVFLSTPSARRATFCAGV